MQCTNDSFVDFITLTLEQMENFTYLVSIIDEIRGSDAHVKVSIGKVSTAFLQLKNIWNTKQLSVDQHYIDKDKNISFIAQFLLSKSLNRHKMEPFVQVFFAIDKDGTETITIDELKKYVADNNLDEMMVTFSIIQLLFKAKKKETKNKTSMDTEHSGILA
ncbi:unnamed protein product [Schistosoma curassoni]|uniref:EF-hand domain-containing protein n=1 Tax=Schistosoma curassoni TaxID=6186 RepID=A0A183JHG4_9TREM|nr:unnamed protein product [Schistosoma curassoni]